MSGRETKPRLPRMPGQRAKASLVAAAHAQAGSDAAPAEDSAAPTEAMEVDPPAPAASASEPAPAPATAPAPAPVAAPPAPVSQPAAAPPPPVTELPDIKPSIAEPPRAGPSAPATRAPPASIAISRTTSGGSTAAPSDAPSAGVPKMKFKPKMPIRRNTQAPEPAAAAATPEPEARPPRGAARGRGRGGAGTRGGRPPVVVNTIAAGPFGGARAGSSRRVIPAAPARSFMSEMQTVEVYSDNEDGTRTGVIDIEAVSALGESAPTSLWRDRDLGGGKAKAKAVEKAKAKDLKRKKQREAPQPVAEGGIHVKAEPVSPSFEGVPLPGLPGKREGDSMIAADAVQDVDESGRRIRATTSGTVGTTNTSESDEVNVAQAVDLSESESEDEEDDMEGDFVFVPGLDNPEDKLFTFQFPPNFPRFASKTPLDAPPDAAEPPAADVKPSAAALRRKKAANLPPPQGRIGTLCVMKSGKVKLVLGEGDGGIVMNVTPGVNASFLQQLVHLDTKARATTVLGEVHKGYVVTPDVDRLLEELFINGGETPGDRERAQAAAERRVKVERGLVKMEPSSP